MNILHYSLGFPPYRTGGMTKYCIDLMSEQLRVGHQVSMIWPGRIYKYGYKCSIKKVKKEKIGKSLDCRSYEIINPLPVPLLDGIKDIQAFIQIKEESIFYNFFKEKNIEVLHIHTLMGLPKECVSAAKKLGIKVIYTTHDYFGLCPKLGFICDGKICEDDNNYRKCVKCNETALSLNKIKILQSSLYRNIKDTKIIKILRKKHNEDSSKTNLINISDNYEKELIKYSEQYKTLREFYIELLKEIDTIHYNSCNTKEVFGKFISTKKNSKVLSITHSSIADNRRIRFYDENINLAYLGPIANHKGFYSLKQVCDNLYNLYSDKFKLHIFANYEGNETYLVKHNPYKYEELSKVMDSIDILIVPSLSETFGFTVLEALSYGVPVIVSKYVGAKDLIKKEKSGSIYENLEELQSILEDIIINTKSKMCNMNEYIIDFVRIKKIEEHAKEIEKLYLNLI
ncbi:glycosyltransferase [[Clostridium] sordellii]|uniref:glycosyltransferase n=1 Tax=Paraclostridium sordellii TaxID=1505 RepID=UPI0005E1C976|nr:glycosyltransferase [Paeniclostridium sordellii]CEQ31479.1 glycosyltransferase [[Clostridium] sordellii] [Paeniclostridium sordellii]